MTTMADIEALAETLALQRENLAVQISDLNCALGELRDERLPLIRSQAELVALTTRLLRKVIDDNRGLFFKPRTRILHGLKIGIRKLPGRIGWDDAAAVIRRIRKHFPGAAAAVIEVKETLRRDALAAWPAADLAKIGVSAGDATDEVVVAPVDSDVDKIVAALLKEPK